MKYTVQPDEQDNYHDYGGMIAEDLAVVYFLYGFDLNVVKDPQPYPIPGEDRPDGWGTLYIYNRSQKETRNDKDQPKRKFIVTVEDVIYFIKDAKKYYPLKTEVMESGYKQWTWSFTRDWVFGEERQLVYIVRELPGHPLTGFVEDVYVSEPGQELPPSERKPGLVEIADATIRKAFGLKGATTKRTSWGITLLTLLIGAYYLITYVALPIMDTEPFWPD